MRIHLLYILVITVCIIQNVHALGNTKQFQKIRNISLKSCINSSKDKLGCTQIWCDISAKNPDCKKTSEITNLIPQTSIQSIDSLYQLVLVKDTAEFTRNTYCYFVFQGVISTKAIEPLVYSLAVKGNSLANTQLEEYEKWLVKNKQGRSCARTIKRELGVLPSVKKLRSSFKSKKYLVHLNPYAIMADGPGVIFSKQLQTLFNHELLHILFAEHPHQRDRIISIWRALSDNDQKNFKSKHPSYNFEDETVLLKEFFSYSYEENPEAAERLLR